MFAYYVLFLFCICQCAFLYLIINRTYKYWKQKGIVGPNPEIFYGNFKPVFYKVSSVATLAAKIYKQYPNDNVVGIYQGLTPTLVIRDLNVIKSVIIKNFRCFVDRGFKVSEETITKSLFLEDGDDWRVLRHRLSPIFTSGKLKEMLPLLKNCVEGYIQYVSKLVSITQLHEIRALNAKYTLKTIGSCAFGLDINTFSEDINLFKEMGDRIFEPNIKQMFCAFLHSLIPGITAKLHIKVFRQEIIDFFSTVVNQIIKEREGQFKIRKDFMDLLIEMKEQGKVYKSNGNKTIELEVTDEIIIAQALTFYAAGFETSSGAMSFLLYELALNPKVQHRCYNEIKKAMLKYDGDLTFETLTKLEYLSMTFDETLRKYPTAGVLFRQCTSDIVLSEINLEIKKGTKILIPILAIHNDAKYFPNPEKFKPERFNVTNKVNMNANAYMPFGDGPRICIGMRFAKIQSLLGIAYFLYNFEVETSSKTVKKIRFDPRFPTLVSEDGIWLNIKRR